MQAETTYIVIYSLAGFLVLLTIWRFIRAAGTTISQIRFESERDRYQHQRIARQREQEYHRFRKATRKINGKARGLNWDESDRRAHRSYHVDDMADEVFDPLTDDRAMDIATPWGWPTSVSKKVNRFGYQAKPRRRNSAFANFFRTKQVVDDEYRARQQRCIRSLVEDRYGRVSDLPEMEEIEWSAPKLPPELLKERASDQVLGQKRSDQNISDLTEIRALKLVHDVPGEIKKQYKVSG